MFKIRKSQTEPLTDLTHRGDSIGPVASQTRTKAQWMLAGVAVALLVAAVGGGFLWMRQQDDRAAADLLYEATRRLTERSFLGGPPSVRTPEELDKAVAGFQKILTEFPQSSAAPQASYLLGNAFSDRKDWEGAVTTYQAFLTRYGSHRALVPLVSQRLAYAQLAQGNIDEAEKTLTALAQMHGAPNKDQALYELGKINEILSRPEGALAQYQQIIKDHPSSPFAAEASTRIKMLDRRKVSPSSPP